jgi:peptide chain release factor 1
MLDKLEAIKHRYDEIGEMLMNPNTIQDMKRFTSLSKEYKDLEKLVHVYKSYQKSTGY